MGWRANHVAWLRRIAGDHMWSLLRIKAARRCTPGVPSLSVIPGGGGEGAGADDVARAQALKVGVGQAEVAQDLVGVLAHQRRRPVDSGGGVAQLDRQAEEA